MIKISIPDTVETAIKLPEKERQKELLINYDDEELQRDLKNLEFFK